MKEVNQAKIVYDPDLRRKDRNGSVSGRRDEEVFE